MQCPSCGFENLPGRTECCVCSASFSGSKPNEQVYPIRARDRSFWERISWRLSNTDLWSFSRRFRDRVGEQMESARPLDRFRTWLGFREMLEITLSAIPGVGHMRVLGQPTHGLFMLLGSLAALALGVFLYRSSLSNYLAFLLLVTSMFSMWRTIRKLRPTHSEQSQTNIGIGLALIVFAIYFGSYMGLRWALNSIVTLAHIGQPVNLAQLHRGDTMLTVRRPHVERGDIVVADSEYGFIVGVVVGLPRETIGFADRIYVDGNPTVYSLPRENTEGGGVANVRTSVRQQTLSADQWCIMPVVDTRGFVLDLFAEVCIVDRNELFGEVTAVVNPAPHRKALARINVFGDEQQWN